MATDYYKDVLYPRISAKPSEQKVTEFKFDRSTVVPLVYGRALVTGIPIPIGVDSGKFYIVYIFAEGEIEGYEKFFIDGQETSEYTGLYTFTEYYGTLTQSYDPTLNSINSEWKDPLSGTAYVIAAWTADEKFNSPPKLSAIVKGKKVYDHRTNTTRYSENPILCAVDLKQSTRYGGSATNTMVNWDSVDEAANDCGDAEGTYWSFEKSSTSDNSLVSAYTGEVATLRPYEGYGGGQAIAVESGTSNLVHYSSFEEGDFTGWSVDNTYATITVTTDKPYIGSYSCKMVQDGINSTPSNINQSDGILSNYEYTLSVRFWAEEGNYAHIELIDRANSLGASASKEGNGSWQVISVSYTMGDGANLAICYLYSTFNQASNTVYYDAVQLEEKNCATSYISHTNSPRADSNLRYNGVLGNTAGTIMFDVYFEDKPAPDDSTYILSNNAAYNDANFLRLNTVWVGLMYFYVYDTSGTAHGKSFSANNFFTAKTWHNICLVYDQDNQRLDVYVDGNLATNGTSIDLGTLNLNTDLWLGSSKGTDYFADIMIDNLVVMPYAIGADSLKNVIAGKARYSLNYKVVNPVRTSYIEQFILDHCNCDSLFSEGNWYYKIHKERNSVATFAKDEVWDVRLSRPKTQDVLNRVRASYTHQDDWREDEYALESPKLMDGSEILSEGSFDFTGAGSLSQVHRLCTYQLNKRISDLQISFQTYNTKGIERFDRFQFTHEDYGLTNKDFYVLAVHNNKRILATEYSSDLFSDEIIIEPNIPEADLPLPTELPDDVTGLIVTESTDQAQNFYWQISLNVSWTASVFDWIKHYEVWIKKDSDDPYLFTTTRDTSLSIVTNNELADYIITIKTVSNWSMTSSGASFSITTTGKDWLPTWSTGAALTTEVSGGVVLLSWTEADDKDITTYKIKRGSTSDNWDTAINVATVNALNYSDRDISIGTLRYFVKAIDSVGQEMASALISDIEVTYVGADIIENYNNSNDMNSDSINAPTIANDGTAITKVVNTDGSVNITFNWSWVGTEADIDGFQVFIYSSDTDTSYTFGSSIDDETIHLVTPNYKNFILHGVPADKYYTFGVRAYRVVNSTVNSTGVIYNDEVNSKTIIQPSLTSEDPYQPSATVEFHGDVYGTIENASDRGDLALRDSINWSEVVNNGGKPDDGADVTSDKLPYLISPSFLINGSFEGEENVGYYLSSYASITTSEHYSGSQCLKQNEATGGPETFFDAKIPASQGDKFYVSGYAKRDESALPSNVAAIQIREYDSSDTQLVVHSNTFDKDVANWQFIEEVYTISNANTAYFKVACGTGEGSTGTWYFDVIYVAVATSELDADVTDYTDSRIANSFVSIATDGTLSGAGGGQVTITGIGGYSQGTINGLLDGKINCFYQDDEPTSGDVDANDFWVDTNDRNKVYIYNGSSWEAVSNQDAAQAIQDAADAWDLADHKRRVFVATPTPPYDNGDLWKYDTDTIYVCINEKEEGESYSAGDWENLATNGATLGDNFYNSGGDNLSDEEVITYYGGVGAYIGDPFPRTDGYPQILNMMLQNSYTEEGWYKIAEIPLDSYGGVTFDGIVHWGVNAGRTQYQARVKFTVYGDSSGDYQNSRYRYSGDDVSSHLYIRYSGSPATVYVYLYTIVHQTFGMNGVWNVNAGSNTKFWSKLLYTDCLGTSDPGGTNVPATANYELGADITANSDFVTAVYPADKADLQDQIDGKITSWFTDTDPQSTWDGTDASHEGDMWWNTSTKKLKRWSGTAWSSDIEDQKAIDAYELADDAKDTADGKRRVFVATPTPPYDEGDLWKYDAYTLYVCTTAKAQGESYSAGDWSLISDVTNQNTAAAIIDQGALATQDVPAWNENSVTNILLPKGGSYYASGGNTGAIKVTLPQSWTRTMVRFDVDVVLYDSADKHFVLTVGGYTYSGTSQWVNEFAHIIGSKDSDNRVRFGHDGSKCCIIIGETSSAWNHPRITVRNLQLGYSNISIDDWNDGWDVSIVSDISGITFTGDISDNLIDSQDTATVNGTAAATVAAAVGNYNNSNDMNSDTITDPAISTGGGAVDHTINDDGSANISFEWTWTGTEADIDGFEVYLYVSATNETHTFSPTTPSADELVHIVPANRRAFIINGVPADHYFTFGVRAYRAVNTSVDSSGLITSAIKQPSITEENPYQPTTTPEFHGDIKGTIGNASDASDFVNKDNPIDSSNVSTFIDSAAIGAAEIGEAHSSDGTFKIDFDNKYLKVWDGSSTLRVHLGYIP